MRRLLPALLALLLAAPAAAEIPLMSPLPEAGWPDLSGRTVKLSALKGKPVLVNLWASWCQPCIKELPIIQGLHTRYAAAGLQVVGINIDVDLGTAETFTERHALGYTVLHDARGDSAKPFRVQQIPATFLYDAEGRLVWQTDDEIEPGDPTLRAALKRVLPQDGPARTEAGGDAKTPRKRPDARLWPLRRAPSPIPPTPSR